MYMFASKHILLYMQLCTCLLVQSSSLFELVEIIMVKVDSQALQVAYAWNCKANIHSYI